MSTILQKIILTGCTGLFMVPATMGQPAVETHLQTPPDPLQWVVNRMDRAWFQTQPTRVDPFLKAKAGAEPAITSVSPLSQPMEWPPKPVDESKVAVLNSVQTRLWPPRVLMRCNRDAKRKRVVG
jgi:hypothetical protein